jgi:hypothetical protein
MRVHVLHHGRCFDGAASAALFTAFMRARHGSAVELIYIPKHHRQGDPFDDGDFVGADELAVLDFRYTQRPGLTWYFDHHRSAFQLPGDRDHFEARAPGGPHDHGHHFHHDANAPSCTGYLAKIAAAQFGFDVSAHAELIHWAEIIDTAAFPNPEAAVLYEQPAMQLAAWIQAAEQPQAIARFIEELLQTPLARLAEEPWIRELVEPRLTAHHADIELLRQLGRVENGVFSYDLLDEGPRILSHFIPYYLVPDCTYSVGIYAHPDGDLRLSVGFNPWQKARRTHDLAELCERHGGGGHPYVAGASFLSEQVDQMRAAAHDIIDSLAGEGGTGARRKNSLRTGP